MPGAMEPYLSLVVTARNDDHGGNLLGRMQAFVSGWIEQARRYQIPSELIIVEWNPPPARPGLIDALRWPDDLGPLRSPLRRSSAGNPRAATTTPRPCRSTR